MPVFSASEREWLVEKVTLPSVYPNDVKLVSTAWQEKPHAGGVSYKLRAVFSVSVPKEITVTSEWVSSKDAERGLIPSMQRELAKLLSKGRSPSLANRKGGRAAHPEDTDLLIM